MRWRAIILILAGVVVYASALHAPFILDDTESIANNLTVRSLTGALTPPRESPVDDRPLVNVSFAANYAYDGLNVTSYRVVNLALHLGCALLLFAIVRRTLQLPSLAPQFASAATDVAWVVALLWTLHPLNSEVVDYVTQRSESLMALAYLATLYCAIRGATARRGGKWIAGSIVSCLAGVFCKESIATAPVVVLLYDRVFLFDSIASSVRARRHLYVGLAGSWVVLGLVLWLLPRTSTGFDTGVTPWLYLLNQTPIVSHYLMLTLWPHPLVVDYGLPVPLTFADVWAPALALIGGAIAAAVLLWRRPPVGFCLAWFFITLAPTSSLMPIATEVGAERRMYLPLAGLIAIAVVGGDVMLRRLAPRAIGARRAVVAVTCALMALGVVVRNREYNDALMLARVTVERWPNGRAHAALGAALVTAGKEDEALAEFERATAGYPAAHYPLGAELIGRGRVDEGIDHLRAFATQYPRNPNALAARRLVSTALYSRGQFDDSAAECDHILAQYPRDAATLVMLGDIRLNQRRFSESIQAYETAKRADPQVAADALVLTRWASALAYNGRMVDAVTTAREAMRIAATDPRVQKFGGNLLAASGDLPAAAAAFRRAVDLDPGDQEARTLLARADAYVRSRQP